jgi:hypothetical protein
LLPVGQPQSFYEQQFLAQFGAGPKNTVTAIDAVRHALPIGPAMFEGPALAVDPRQMLLMASVLQAPDEIWLRWERAAAGNWQLARRYIASYAIDGEALALLGVIDFAQDGWRATTLPISKTDTEAANLYRFGMLQYRRLP